MSSAPFDTKKIRQNFSRAASHYSERAVLQHEVEARLLEHLDYLSLTPTRILDVGSGPGSASLALKKRFPKAQIVAMDLALPMARIAKKNAGFWRPSFTSVCGDTRALPFAAGSFDLVFSNLCMQWINDLPALFAEWRRVMTPNGFLMCSTFGPETLIELRSAFAQADNSPHLSDFAPIQAIGDGLMTSGFRNPVLDTDRFTLTYKSMPDLMRDLKSIGANNAVKDRRQTLTGKGRIARATEAYEQFREADGQLPATYEVIYAHAFAPEPGQPMRHSGHDVTAVPLSAIPIRRRQ